ncbi:MAG: hypothetical protein HY423_08330 [Candidatus Lambdaproteobacteria bacterium]|nr:hypothetical protein [Candidatus Lambdaproteobacteria bacterium]
MRLKPLLSLVLAVGIVIGFLLLFPWEWVALLVLLAGLVTVQVILVRRHLRVMEPAATPQEIDAEVVRRALAAARSAQAGTAAAEPRQANIDPQVFSRFRAHLEAAERGAPSGVAEARSGTAAQLAGAQPLPDAGRLLQGAAEDRVELSKGARRPAAARALPKPYADAATPKPPPATHAPATPAANAQPLATREAPERDLFADLRPQPPAAVATPPAAAPAAPADEIRAALEEAGTPQSLAAESASLLKLALEAMQRGDRAAAKAGLGHYQALLAEHAELADWQASLLEARLAMGERDFSKAVLSFDALLKQGPPPEEERVLGLIGELLAQVPLDRAQGAGLRVSLLQKALAAFRQARNRPAMDRIYTLLEQAQEQAGDERRLVQFLKNHLEIRRVMGDLPGQLALIDQIGNRLYRLGDAEGSREYYELGLRVRTEHEGKTQASESPPAQSAPKTTTA